MSMSGVQLKIDTKNVEMSLEAFDEVSKSLTLREFMSDVSEAFLYRYMYGMSMYEIELANASFNASGRVGLGRSKYAHLHDYSGHRPAAPDNQLFALFNSGTAASRGRSNTRMGIRYMTATVSEPVYGVVGPRGQAAPNMLYREPGDGGVPFYQKARLDDGGLGSSVTMTRDNIVFTRSRDRDGKMGLTKIPAGSTVSLQRLNQEHFGTLEETMVKYHAGPGQSDVNQLERVLEVEINKAYNKFTRTYRATGSRRSLTGPARFIFADQRQLEEDRYRSVFPNAAND